MNPVVEEFCQRAADYMSLINSRPVAESIPYAVAVERHKEAADETLRQDDRQQLLDQIVGLKEKIVKLEQDREHWMLETQLVKIKSEKRAKERAAAAEEEEEEETKRRKRKGEKNAEDEDGGETGSGLGDVATEERVADDAVKDADDDDDEEASSLNRENVIKEHYVARIQELTAQLQVADSKSMHFYTDSITLQVRQLRVAVSEIMYFYLNC